MGGRGRASGLSAERIHPKLHPDELLARGARPGIGDLGFLDLAPVVIVRRHDTTAFEQALQTPRSRAVIAAARGHFRRNQVGDLITVGAVGADRAGRAAPRPADRVEAVAYLPVFVEEFGSALIIGDALERRRRIADCGDDQRGRDLVGFAGAARPALLVELGPLDDDLLRLAVAFDADRLGEEVEYHA